MQIKRRLLRRTETVEQIKVKMPGSEVEFLIAEKRMIEGERFFLQVFRSDVTRWEKLFECHLQGKIEIEQTSGGDFTLVCKAALEPEQKLMGDK